jgi:PAS domain S-box-containing protein
MNILLIEDNPEEVAAIRKTLTLAEIGSFTLLWADRLATGITRLGATSPDLVLLDLSLPDSRGLDTFTRLHAHARQVPVVVLAEVQDAPLGLEAARLGAQDYLLKQQVHQDPVLLGHVIRHTVDRRRREEELEQGRREAQVVADLARSINASLDLDTILRRVTESARDLCRSDGAAIALADDDAEAPVFRHMAGSSYEGAAGRRVEPGQGSGGQVLQTGLPFRTDNYVEDRRVTPDALVRVAPGQVLAQLVVPILSQERLEGLLYAEHRSGGTFTDHDELILLRLADQAAIAVRNSRLFARERAARAAAEASEATVRQLFASAPLPMWLFDAETLGFIAVNEAAVRHYGYTENEFLRLRVSDLHPADGIQPLLAEPEVARGDRRPAPRLPREWKHRAKDGRALDVEIVTHPLTLGSQRVVLAVLQDVTPRKRAEAALRESEERLRQAERLEAASRVAAVVAHDFNNLLTVIGGSADLLLDVAGQDERPRKHAEAIQAAVTHATALTSQLLAFGQQQAHAPVVLDLNAVVHGMLGALRRLAGDHVHVSFTPAPALGRVRADRRQIEQLIVNLSVNARDATPRGGHLMIETLDALLDPRFAERHPGVRPGRYVLLAVSDTGHGIPPDVQPRIFEPFFTTKSPGEAVGLGLSTVYGIVKQSEGEILVYSEPGRGTTFKIYLPQVGDGDATASAVRPASALRGSETILLV